MDSVVVTFLKYLEDSSKRLEQGIILRASKTGRRELNSEDERDLLRISERKNLSRILQVPKEEWDLHGEIFIQFDYLSEMLEESLLNARGKFAILQRLLEKNLATNIIHQDARCFDIQKIDDYEFTYMTRDQFLEFVRTDEYGRLKTKDESELTEHEKNMLDEFNRYSDANPLDVGPVIENHKLINAHYFEKRESFNEEDVDLFLTAVKSFGLSDTLIETFRNLLLREVNKRQKRLLEESRVVVSAEVKPVVQEPTISRKEYNLIERELRQYFDLKTMEVVSPLDLDRQIYCVGLLIKLGFSDDRIRDILKIMNKNGYCYDNPITMFVALQEKLEYYKDVEGIKEAVETIIGAMQEIMIVSGAEYEEWKEFIGSEMQETLKLLPKTYDYEIDKARKGSK